MQLIYFTAYCLAAWSQQLNAFGNGKWLYCHYRSWKGGPHVQIVGLMSSLTSSAPGGVLELKKMVEGCR